MKLTIGKCTLTIEKSEDALAREKVEAMVKLDDELRAILDDDGLIAAIKHHRSVLGDTSPTLRESKKYCENLRGW